MVAGESLSLISSDSYNFTCMGIGQWTVLERAVKGSPSEIYFPVGQIENRVQIRDELGSVRNVRF